MLLAVAGVGLYVYQSSIIDDLYMTAAADGKTSQSIDLFREGDKYYAFLPSFADTGSLKLGLEEGYTAYLDGEPYATGDTLPKLAPNKAYSLRLTNPLGFTICDTALELKKGKAVSAMSLELIDKEIENVNANKSVNATGFATVIKEDKHVDYKGKFDVLHGHGNSTWPQPKKSYTLKFKEDTPLLGMEGKNYVLLSNSFDESGLRNKLAYDAAKELGVPYAVDAEYVDLYVNNRYLGLYLLAERVEVGAGRVEISDLSEETHKLNANDYGDYAAFEQKTGGKLKRGLAIPNNPADITGGYLLELEHRSTDIAAEPSVIQTDDLFFAIASPKYASKQQVDYIFDKMNKTEEQLKKGDLSGVDVASFAKYYMIQEFFAQTDLGSFFCCKDKDSVNGKIRACAIWDFDESIGNSWLWRSLPPNAFYQNTDNWFNRLLKTETFKNEVNKLYAQSVKPKLDTLLYNKLAACKNQMSDSFDMDKIRWRSAFSGEESADKSQNRFDTLDEHIRYITDFMNRRVRFLDEAWLGGADYKTVSFITYENTEFKQYCTVKAGEILSENPSPESGKTKGCTFLGWFDPDGNRYEPGKPVTESVRYTARWKVTGMEKIKAAFKELFENKNSHGEILLVSLAGLAVLFIVAAVFVIKDIRRVRRSRRAQHGKKH